MTLLYRYIKSFNWLFNSLIFWFFSFISTYSFSTLSTKTNSSWIIYDSDKALEIKTSILFNLAFSKNAILSCFPSFSWLLTYSFLFLPLLHNFFNPIAELVIVLGIPSKEAKEKTERHPVIPETEIRKYLI